MFAGATFQLDDDSMRTRLGSSWWRSRIWNHGRIILSDGRRSDRTDAGHSRQDQGYGSQDSPKAAYPQGEAEPNQSAEHASEERPERRWRHDQEPHARGQAPPQSPQRTALAKPDPAYTP